MARATGIEIGPDSLLFAAVRSSRSSGPEVFAARRYNAGEWPEDERELADAIRTIRHAHRFPRPAAVVVWNVNDGVEGSVHHDLLGSLTAADFHVVSILTPPQALARVASTTRRGTPADAIAWLALNTWGASIAIVRDGVVLFSRTFSWTYKPDLPSTKAQLLQRYLLISHLAPELSHGFTAVRDVHGATVSLVVTCGNLPELRSLTLPLIEELDVEVETLDSTDGLAARSARLPEFAELAPALRLATAAASSSDVTAGRQPLWVYLSRAALTAALIGAVAWAGYSYWHVSRPSMVQGSTSLPNVPQSRPLARSSPSPSGTTTVLPSPAVSAGSPPATATPQPVATRGSDEPNRASAPGRITAPHSAPAQSRPVASDTRTAATPKVSEPGAPLNEPLPRVDTVLIDQDRRLAILDGAVVRVGDAVGSRTVLAIAREAIVLREPSGRIVRVRPRLGM
jgi:hypothetical protein